MNRTLTVVCLALLVVAAPAAAQTVAFTPDPVDMAAAKREGAVTWYTSTAIGTAQKIANLFQAETGIKVELFRSGGSAVLRRFMQEIDARRVIADVMTISDPAEVIARADKGVAMPKNWTDLVDPKYKGLMVMPDPSYTAIQLMVIGTLSRKYGWEFYEKLRANEIMIVQSHHQGSETPTRGDRLIP